MNQLGTADRQADRIVASPYARRLARERGVNLSGLRGSGPGGRIVAGDVGPYVAPPAFRDPEPAPSRDQPKAHAVEPATEPTPARRVGAFATTLDMVPAETLIDQIGAANAAVGLDDVLIKAIACAMDWIELGSAEMVWRHAGGDTVLSGVDRLTLGRIAKARSAADQRQDASTSPHLLVTRIRETGLRPVQATLAPGVAMRLTLAGADEGPMEALLTYDEDMVLESQAARLLAQLRERLEVPLRLLV